MADTCTRDLMDVDLLTRLVPLGGATVMFMILLGWLMSERATWVAERKGQDEAHIKEMERVRKQCQTDIENVRHDLDINLKQLRERNDELETENGQLRGRLRGQT